MLDRLTFVTTRGRHVYIYGASRGRPRVDDITPEPVALQQRLDLLTDTWIAISPARNERPDSGDRGSDDSARCPLCPGGPDVPFEYDACVFDNRYPALVANPPQTADDARVAPARGRCEVVLYTSRHEGSLATLTPLELARVVAIWRDRTAELWADPGHQFVMAFENRGEAVGATLSHPHGQIYAVDHVPPFIAGRIAALARFRERNAACLGCRVVATDRESNRLVAANRSFVVAVPFAARWPFEVHVRARRHGLRRLTDLRLGEQRDLARALRDVVVRYRSVFAVELPYMMVALEAPGPVEDWHLAFEFYPPHRSERLIKVRASVETATGLFINDTLPEVTANQLAALPGPPCDELPALVVRRVEQPYGRHARSGHDPARR